MGKAFAAPVLMSTLLAAALSGCGATGELYPETLAKTGPLHAGTGRIVLLRSDDFANRNVASPVYVRIQEDLIGKLAHSGFLIAQVAAGDVVLKASARNRMFGICELPVSVSSGETLYVDVDPRSGEPKLSVSAYKDEEERRAHREYRQKLKAEANFGTLGDLLRAKLGQTTSE